MASISPPTFPSRSDPNPHKFTFQTAKISSRLKRSSSPSTLHSYHALSTSHSLSRVSDSSSLCRCHNNSGDSDSPSPSDNSNRGWDSAIQEVLRNAIKRFDDYLSSYRNQSKDSTKKNVEVLEGADEEEDWDWDRWWKHFSEIDEQERIVSILKAQLAHAVNREDYEDASRLKVAIAAAATNDTVGRVMSHLNSAIKEERYREAAFMRDYAGTGLVGWWAGTSDNTNDPYGRIIHISAEHGRYLARSYSPRQLATASAGVPLFEIFLTVNRNGEYKQKAVYLRRMGTRDFPVVSSKSLGPTGSLNPSDSTEDKTDLFASIEDTGDGEDRDDDFDMVEGLSGFDNILRDMIPGVKVKVLKVTAPEKVDRDLISKVIEQIMEEEDEEKDTEVESVDIEDEDKGESDQEHNEIEMDAGGGILDGEERSEIAVKVVVGGLVQKVSNSAPNKNLIRVPARLQKRGRLSFSFSIEKDDKQQVSNGKGQTLRNKKAKLQGQHSMDHVMFDLAKFIGRGKIPMKVLKDVGELIKLTLTQAQNRQLLSGSTTFSRIEIPASPDPLNGLYIGAHGLYSSEVIHLRRKIGQWQEDEDGDTKEPPSLEFYEYVEAVKLTGDPYVPAGQVAFRAKIGKRYQLPHKGIIPEEFGVIARYKGEGRLAEPGFRNPRWVDGELVILDGKYIKGGPVVGFVYWAPEYHFLVFFNRLRLQE